jgi:ATP-binding cassette subfamily B multidrug efflux pump
MQGRFACRRLKRKTMRLDLGDYEEEVLGKPYDAGLIKRLFPLVKPYKVWFFFSIVIVVSITLLSLLVPYITKEAIDRYIVPVEDGNPDQKARFLKVAISDPKIKDRVLKYEGLFKVEAEHAFFRYDKLAFVEKDDLAVFRKDDLSGVFWAAALLLLVVCFNYVMNFVQMMVMEYTGQMIMHDLRMKVYNHIQGLSVSFFNKNPIGRLVTRTTNDVQNMHEMFTSVFTFIFRDIFLIFGIIVTLLIINWKLALITLSVVLPVIVASFYFAEVARDVYRTLRIKVAEINTRFSETVQGIRVIKLFTREKENFHSFKDLNHENYLASMRQVHVFAIYMPIIELMGFIALALIIYYGGSGIIAQTVSLGVLAAFIAYIRMFFRPIRDMAEKFNIMQNALASAERIFLLLDNKESLSGFSEKEAGHGTVSASWPDRDKPDKDKPDKDKIENIEFKQVSFSYVEDEAVLKEISFVVDHGETVAIVGPTGAGKTSIINLIVRFYDPSSGTVCLNGSDIKDIDESVVRSKMALVMQDPFLFSGTIKDNIAFGKKDISEKELEHVIKVSNCNFFIDRLKDGVNTVVSEGGSSLSSGERQLISIARAFAKNPDLIIFDEATSYIDTDTEQKIQEALANLTKERTSIIIAHRLSTVRNADRIIVLNKGRIVETGSDEELMDRKGFYYRLHQS